MQEKKFQLEIANIECRNTNCTRQMIIMNNMIQYEGQNGQNGNYFGNLSCQQCKKNNYFLWCECGQYLISSVPFYDGYFHDCTNTKCRKKFQIVQCPYCVKYNVYDNHSYKMGKMTQCVECSQYFQQVACSSCKEDTYFDGKYQEGIPYQCCNKNCSKNQQHINCPSCLFPNLYNMIKPLMITSCQNRNSNDESQNCNKKFYYLPCKKCNDFLVKEGDTYPDIENGKNIKCENCKLYTSINQCIFCKQYNLQISDKSGDYGRVQCQQMACRKKFMIIKCEKCKEFNQIEDKNQKNVFLDTCKHCNKEAFFMTCPECSAGSQLILTDLSASRQVDCPACKAQVQHDITEKINTLNNIDCKICMEKPATFLMDTCNHLFGCEECAESLKRSSNSSRVKCPLCRTLGQVKKIYF